MRRFLSVIGLAVVLTHCFPAHGQLQHAPKPRVVGKRTAVPMDIQKLEATLVFDLGAATARAVADVWFLAGETDGTPVFDLRQEIGSAQLDGEEIDPTALQAHDLGRMTGTMRILDVNLKARSLRPTKVSKTASKMRASTV